MATDTVAHGQTGAIPLIDLEAHGSDNVSLGQALHEAATSLGFMYLVNTGLQPKGMFDIAKDFFLNEAAEEKERCGISTRNLGYIKPQQESLDPSKPGDRKETMNIAMCKQNGSFDQQLPSRLQARAAHIARFERDCHGLILRLLRALTTALQLPEGTLTEQNQHHNQNTSILRLLRYPATAPGIAPKTHPRAGAHSDYGLMTLLFQENQPAGSGLQVLPPTANQDDPSAWKDVPVVPNAVLVNVGDALELQTGALYRSTVHRVVEVPSSVQGDRYSMAFFNQPNDDVVLNALVASNQVTPNDIARMERKGIKLGEQLTANEHLQRRLAATYSGRKEAY